MHICYARRPGRKAREVKNLGWLLKYLRTECVTRVMFVRYAPPALRKHRFRMGDGFLVVTFADGAKYVCDFADEGMARHIMSKRGTAHYVKGHYMGPGVMRTHYISSPWGASNNRAVESEVLATVQAPIWGHAPFMTHGWKCIAIAGCPRANNHERAVGRLKALRARGMVPRTTAFWGYWRNPSMNMGRDVAEPFLIDWGREPRS